MNQVKVQALLAHLVYLELEENLADLDFKVGGKKNNTILFLSCIAFICDTTKVSTVHVKKVSPSFWQQVTEVCREILGCQVSPEKRVNMELLELGFQVLLALKVC